MDKVFSETMESKIALAVRNVVNSTLNSIKPKKTKEFRPRACKVWVVWTMMEILVGCKLNGYFFY